MLGVEEEISLAEVRMRWLAHGVERRWLARGLGSLVEGMVAVRLVDRWVGVGWMGRRMVVGGAWVGFGIRSSRRG